MFKTLSNKRLWVIGVGLLGFVLVAMFGNYLPVSLTPKLPDEISSVIRTLGLSDSDALRLIKSYAPNKTQKTSSQSDIHKVTRIIDGDTIEIDGTTTVRYIGINAPEKYSNITKAECWNVQSTKNNSDLVLGKDIRLEKDVSETDKYGRLLRYVYIGGMFINEELVKSGSARAKAYSPDTRESDGLALAESAAKNNRVGLWGACF